MSAVMMGHAAFYEYPHRVPINSNTICSCFCHQPHYALALTPCFCACNYNPVIKIAVDNSMNEKINDIEKRLEDSINKINKRIEALEQVMLEYGVRTRLLMESQKPYECPVCKGMTKFKVYGKTEEAKCPACEGKGIVWQ